MRLIDRLRQRGRRTAGEIGVTDIGSRDRMNSRAQRSRCQRSLPATVERARSDNRCAVLEGYISGRSPAVPVTVAVYVTGVPMVAGLLDDVTADVVEPLFTVKTMLSALQGRKFPSPL